jgi:hypothetical protein
VEDARRFLSHPYLAEDPKRLTIEIPVEDPDNPDERVLETARRIRALGANTRFTQVGTHQLFFFGNRPFREWYTQQQEKGEEDDEQGGGEDKAKAAGRP